MYTLGKTPGSGSVSICYYIDPSLPLIVYSNRHIVRGARLRPHRCTDDGRAVHLNYLVRFLLERVVYGEPLGRILAVVGTIAATVL